MGDDQPLGPWSSDKTWTIPAYLQLLQPILSGQEQVCTLAVWRLHGWDHLSLRDTAGFQGHGAEDHVLVASTAEVRTVQSQGVSVALLPATALGPFLPPLASGPLLVSLGPRLHRPTRASVPTWGLPPPSRGLRSLTRLLPLTGLLPVSASAPASLTRDTLRI